MFLPIILGEANKSYQLSNSVIPDPGPQASLPQHDEFTTKPLQKAALDQTSFFKELFRLCVSKDIRLDFT